MFIVLSAYTKKPERTQMNNLLAILKALERQEQTKPKAVDRER